MDDKKLYREIKSGAFSMQVADCDRNIRIQFEKLQKENKRLKENWNKLKEELKEKFEEYRYVEDECLRTMAQEDDSILFSMSCIEKGDSNE